MVEKIFIQPTQDEIDEIETLLSLERHPYTTLKCNENSSIIDISNNYNELIELYSGNQEYINRLNNAFTLLSNERLREIYDEKYSINYINKKFIGFSLQFASIIFKKLTSVAISPISSGNIIQITKDIVREKGLGGFYNRVSSSFIINLISTHYKRKFGLPLNNINLVGSNIEIRELIKRYIIYSFEYLINLITISPLSYTPTNVITKFILERILFTPAIFVKTGSTSPLASLSAETSLLNIKNILISIAYGSIAWYLEKRIDIYYTQFQNQLKDLSSNNTTNDQFIHWGNLIFNNLFIGCAIKSLITLPLQLLHSQYPSMLLTDQILLPVALNPISMSIKLFNRSNRDTRLRLLNSLIPSYIDNLLNRYSMNYL